MWPPVTPTSFFRSRMSIPPSSSPNWDSSTGILWLSQWWRYEGIFASYFINCLPSSMFPSCLDSGYAFLVKNAPQVMCVLLSVSFQMVPGYKYFSQLGTLAVINMFRWYLWGFFHFKVTIFLFNFLSILWRIFWDYTNILFLIIFLRIHWWILPATVITVALLNGDFIFPSYFPFFSTHINGKRLSLIVKYRITPEKASIMLK